MITDVELDRALRAFIADGDVRAPEQDVALALAQVATTPQRRPRPWSRRAKAQRPSPRWILVAAVLVILAAGVTVGVGAMLVRTVSPPDDVSPAPFPSVVTGPVSLVPYAVEDWSARLQIPARWEAIGETPPEYRHFSGDDPVGHLSVTNENPYGTTVCSPECVPFEVPMTIPYDRQAQLAGLKASIGRIAGANAWTLMPTDAVTGLQDGARLDTTAVGPDGSEWRRVHVVGLRARNVVVVAWSQPSAVYDESLLAAVLDGIEITDAPVYSDGDLIPYEGTGFTMSVPGFWFGAEQPLVDGAALSGVRRFGDGRTIVSIGRSDGTFGWCDTGCREVSDITTLDALEKEIRSGQEFGPSSAVTIEGEPARSMTTDQPVARQIVIAMHGGRPVGILLDAGEWDVAPGIFDEMIESFTFVDPVAVEPEQFVLMADGRVRFGLPAAWKQSVIDPERLEKGTVRMTVRAGDDRGSVATCTSPAGPWELCREITPASLDELADAVQPGPDNEPGIGPPIVVRDDTTLGSEPAVVTTIQAYEPPARGAQEVVYVVAMHDGRPYIVRLHTSANTLGGVEGILAGFTFVD